MNSIFETNFIVTPEYCDARYGLSPLAPFLMFQAIASRHAEQLGIGGDAMARLGEFWLAIHTRVDFLAPAHLMDELRACTWPEQCNERDIRSFRSYTLSRGETRIAVGKTEWTILGPEKKLLPFGASNFPKDYVFPAGSAIDARPLRLRDGFTDEELYDVRPVRSTDIDFGQHMNNVAYVKLLLDGFSVDELASGAIRSFEIHYNAPCLEGDRLSLYKRRTEGGYALGIRRGDGKTAALASVTLSARE